MLELWQEMKGKYGKNEITNETLQDWKANYPNSPKKITFPLKKAM